VAGPPQTVIIAHPDAKLYPYPTWHPMMRQAMPFTIDRPPGRPRRKADAELDFFPDAVNALANLTRVELEAGQCVHLPGFWWHEVVAGPQAVSLDIQLMLDSETGLRDWRDSEYSRRIHMWDLEWATGIAFFQAYKDRAESVTKLADFYEEARGGRSLKNWKFKGSNETVLQFLHRHCTKAGLTISPEELESHVRTVDDERYRIAADYALPPPPPAVTQLG